jgi:hypothetical protein
VAIRPIIEHNKKKKRLRTNSYLASVALHFFARKRDDDQK